MDWTTDKITGNDSGPKLGDLVDLLDMPDGADFKAVRMIGPSKRVAKHYMPVFKADGTPVMGKKGQQVKIPKVCLAYDAKANEFSGECPYCDIDPDVPGIEVHTNVIDREIEEEGPPSKKRPRSDAEKKLVNMNGHKCYVKDGKKGAWTPARFWVIKKSAGTKISDATALNKRKTAEGVKTFPPQHPKAGFDLQVKYDSKKPGAEMYAVVKDEKTSLTEEELKYLLWDVNVEKPEDPKTAKASAARFAKGMKAGAKAAGNSDDDDDEDEKPKKSKSSKSKKSAESDDWDEDEDFEDDDTPKKSSKKKKVEDDDDDEPPRKKNKKAVEEDDEDSDDWDDDDEDDAPPAKKKAKKKPVDDDEDEDEEDERPKKKKKKVEEDDEDDVPFDEDEDEDEKPVKKKKKKPVDDDEDEDDEPPRKSKKPVKKKKPADDEDEDEDDDWD